MNKNLQKEFQKIYTLPPNDLGSRKLTFAYKFITGPLKRMPFFYIIPLSLLLAVAMYFVLGPFVIKLVSVLQYGF